MSYTAIIDANLNFENCYRYFIIKIKSDNTGTSASNQFTLPCGTGIFNFNVDISDGSSYTGLTGTTTFTFTGGIGEYTLKISGNFSSIKFNDSGDKLKIIELMNWGEILWGEYQNNSYAGCSNMIYSAIDTPNLTNTKYLQDWFYKCTLVNITNINDFDFSTILMADWAFRASGQNTAITTCNLNTLLYNLEALFLGSSMSTANYTDTVVAFANKCYDNGGLPSPVNFGSQSGRTFDTSRSGGANFANAGLARTYLASILWTISGDTVI